jgi:DNA repair protein RadD
MPPELRDYQTDVIDRVRARLREGARRGLLVGPTGSGKTNISSAITRAAFEKGKRVLFVAHRRRLINQKSERLTQYEVPHGIIMAGERGTSAPVQVASRDTLLSRAVRNDWIGFPSADIVIVDEAHNAASDQFAALLRHYRHAVILGLTATPCRSDGRGLGDIFQFMEQTVPVSQLVREGWLCRVRCYAPDDQGQKSGLVGDPVEHWKRYAEDRPTILFASKVQASMSARDAFIDAGIPAEHVDADTSDDEREAVIRRMEDGFTKVICNVGVFTEGVDIPMLSCCQLMRGADSAVLYFQTIGRCMRPHPGKKDAILIDHAGAIFRHGFPDEDVPWELSTSESIESRVAKEREEGSRGEPRLCPRCAMLYAGPSCPQCGYKELVRKAKPDKRDDELLVEVPRDQAPPDPREERIRYWHRCLAVMAAKNRTCGAAAHMYRAKFDRWPGPDLPKVPSGDQWKMPVRDLYPEYLRRKVS